MSCDLLTASAVPGYLSMLPCCLNVLLSSYRKVRNTVYVPELKGKQDALSIYEYPVSSATSVAISCAEISPLPFASELSLEFAFAAISWVHLSLIHI